MFIPSRQAPAAVAIRLAGSLRAHIRAFALASAFALPAATFAQTQPQEQEFNIPAQPLAAALQQFSSQSNLQVLYNSDDIKSLSSQGVTGRMSATAALTRLLDGTRYSYEVEGNTISLKLAVASSGTLRAVRVEATTDPSITEGTGSYTTQALSVGGKTARDPRHIQQSVSVVTAQRIRDQVLTTTEDALAQTTGVTLTQPDSWGGYMSNASFTSRGFPMGVQIDGGTPGVNYLWYHTGLPDLVGVDHIEVLRGSDGLFGGNGNPGGMVNVVRKRALDQQQMVFDVLVGSWDRVRTQVDVTGPLGLDGRLRGRFAAAQEKRDYFYDADSEKSVVYGVLEGDLTDSTLLSIGLNYENQERNGLYRGLPRYSTGADLGLSRRDCYCTDWSGRDDDSRELFAKLDQSLGEAWRLRLNLSKQWLEYDYQDGYVSGAVSPATGAGSVLTASRTDVSNTLELADVIIDGRFAVAGFEQELVAGFNWQDQFSDGTGVRYYTTAPAVDIFSFDPGAIPQPATPATYVPLRPFGGQKQTGVYATLRSRWTDSLYSIVGLRNSSYEYIHTAGNTRWKESNIRTPYAGLNVDVSDHVTLYASYAQIFQSQAGNLDESGNPLEAMEGDTYELGAKGRWLDGSLAASMALYQTQRKNGSVRVTAPAGQPNCCYSTLLEIDSRGVDTEVTGELLPGWQLSFGYTFNLNEYETGYGARNGTTYSPTTPKHLLKLWSMAQLSGAWSKVRVGGGVNWQSDIYVNGTAATYNPETNEYNGPSVPFRYLQDAYALVSVRGEYQFNDAWSAALNVNNVLDETYYQTVASSSSGNYYGEPRNFVLSINGRW